MQERRRHVVAIADASFCGVGWNHAMPGIVKSGWTSLRLPVPLGNNAFRRPLISLKDFAVNEMSPDETKRAYRKDMLLASVLIMAGLAISGLSLVQIAVVDRQLAQGTPPVQSSPHPAPPASPPPRGDKARRRTPHRAGTRAGPPGCAGAEGRRHAHAAGRPGREDGAANQGQITLSFRAAGIEVEAGIVTPRLDRAVEVEVEADDGDAARGEFEDE